MPEGLHAAGYLVVDKLVTDKLLNVSLQVMLITVTGHLNVGFFVFFLFYADASADKRSWMAERCRSIC